MTTAAAKLPVFAAPVGAWNAIEARLDAGEPVLLAPATTSPRNRSALRPVAAAVAAAALAAIALWPSQRTVYAASSELQVRPKAGTRSVELRYMSPMRCRDCRTLVVRARWRTADDSRSSDEVPTVSAGTLRAVGESMVGSIDAPANAVVGFVSLESPDATWTDNNEGRSWTVVPSTSPSLVLEARRTEILDVLDRDWEGALRLARELVTAFPDSVVAWSDLVDRERRLPEDSALSARNRATLERLDARARTARDTTGETAAHMFRFAWGVYNVAVTSDTSKLPPLMRFWLGRVHDAPSSSARVRELRHVVELQALYERPAESLVHLETLWREDSSDYFLFSVGVQTARRISDTTAMIRWYRRLAQMRPGTEGFVAARLSQFAPSRSEGIARLRAFIAAGGQHDAWRPLGVPRADFARDQRTRVARAQFALSGALLAMGDTAASDQALITAAGGGWNTNTIESLATRMLARGDTVRALQALSMLSADPTRSGAFTDSIRTRTGRVFDSNTAKRWRDSGTVLLRAHLLGEVKPVLLAGPLTDLATESGTAIPVSGQSRPVLISFWSPGCAPSIADLSELAEVQPEIESRGLSLLVVSRGARRRVAKEAALSRLAFAVDADGTLHRALRQWMTPERFLIIPGREGAWRVDLETSELPLLAAAIKAGIVSPP